MYYWSVPNWFHNERRTIRIRKFLWAIRMDWSAAKRCLHDKAIQVRIQCVWCWKYKQLKRSNSTLRAMQFGPLLPDQFSMWDCLPCVWREFNESNQSNTSSDIKITCNTCNEPLHICDLRAGLNEEIAVLYNSAEVACKNSGCSRNLTLGTLAKHEFFNCPNRIIRCPPETCKYKATPTQVNEHVRSCVYMKYVFITCRTAFSIAITDHDCIVLLRRHL